LPEYRARECGGTVWVVPLCRLQALWLGAAAVVLLGGSVALAEPTTKPAQTNDVRIAEAIRQLGDGDYQVRERAARELWAVGRDAEPALQKATKHPNPEIARRARSIL